MASTVATVEAQENLPALAQDRLDELLASPEFRKALVAKLAAHPDLVSASISAITDRNILRRLMARPGLLLPTKVKFTRPPSPYGDVARSSVGLHRLCTRHDFHTVLDVGAGAGEHAKIMHGLGKSVTKLDFGVSVYAQQSQEDGLVSILADANTVEFSEKFDCVWASHVLEHQPNVQNFLFKLKSWAKPEGLIVITVPPAKFELVGGHLSLWTPASLIYNIVFAGIDCSDAEIYHYGYNITAIVRNRSISLPEIHYDKGDVERLAAFLPKGFREGVDGFSVATHVRS